MKRSRLAVLLKVTIYMFQMDSKSDRSSLSKKKSRELESWSSVGSGSRLILDQVGFLVVEVETPLAK